MATIDYDLVRYGIQEQALQLANTQVWPATAFYSALSGTQPIKKLVGPSKIVARMAQENFSKLSSKPIVKEIMCGLIKLKKEQVSTVVNEMLSI